MRILFVNDYGFEAGGAELLLASERAGLEARGHTTELFSLDSEELYGSAEGWVHPYRDPKGRLGTLARQLWHPRASRALRGAIDGSKPDIVHYHSLTRLGAGVLAQAQRVPAVLTLHDYGVVYPLLKRRFPDGRFCRVGKFPCCPTHAGVFRYAYEAWRTRGHRRRMDQLRCVLVPSEFVGAVASACAISRLVHCQNGTPSNEPARGPHRRRAEILYAGRYEREKGVFALISAFEQVADRLPDPQLVFAGEGGAGDALEARARDSRHSHRVKVLGRLSQEQLAAEYAACRVVAVPSLWPEPFGLVGVEAMFAGTPVVGSGRGGMSEWLEDGRTGLVADPDDPAAFGAALARVLTDDALHARLSEGSRTGAARFNIAHHVDALERIYRAATAEPSP